MISIIGIILRLASEFRKSIRMSEGSSSAIIGFKKVSLRDFFFADDTNLLSSGQDLRTGKFAAITNLVIFKVNT